MPSNLANIAAATTAGYSVARGVSDTGVYSTLLEKALIGPTQLDNRVIRALGTGPDSATADAQALAALNAQRALRYGAGTAVSLDEQLNALTVDTN